MSAINGRLLNIPNVNDFKKHLDTLDEKTAALTEKDADLQDQIDRIEDRTNLVDIVTTYAELQDYDTSILSADDVIEVLRDETQNEATTYYRCVILAGGEKHWELIGLTGPYVSLHAEETIDAHKTFAAGITANAIDGLSTPTANDQAANKQYVDNFFVDKATEQIVTGVKHFKADNTALENLGVYSNETILEKATKIKVGGSDAFNIDAEADYTNFWKLTSFLGTTKIAVNDTQAVNFIAYEADSFLEKPTTFKINGNSVLKTSAEGGGKAIFDKPADFHSLVYVGGHEIRFPYYVDFTDNTEQHNKVATIAEGYSNFYKTSTFKSSVNVDGLIFAGGHEIRFPEYVEFKDNTAAHNTVLKIDQNFIDANKVITAKQGLNIDVTPTQAQHAVRKDYVDRKPNLIETTWSELMTLRTNSQLIPGRFYRITDYECTTVQAGTQSAGHAFDIIVRADSENTLNEEASAGLPYSDGYFDNNNLEAWKLWYCLDNDTNRFEWADSTAGKGVIYRMIDEFGNDCPYDFKNILFTSSNKYENAYTFSCTEDGVIIDASILGKKYTKSCYNNIMKEHLVSVYSGKRQSLNFNVFYSTSYTFVCCSNTFGSNCFDNTFDNRCYDNTFGSDCHDNTFGDRCYNNTFGNECYNNTFGNECYSNTFGNYCTDNTFDGGGCSNTFNSGCSSNTFGKNCIHNTFGISCSNNTFGNYCSYNTFGVRCEYIIFGTGSGSTNTPASYYQNNIIDNGCGYLYLNTTEPTLYDKQAQNIHVHSGVTGTDSEYKTITVERNLPYTIDVYPIGSTEMFI